MDKDPDVDIIELADELKNEPILDESDLGKSHAEQPRFLDRPEKMLFVGGSVIFVIIIGVAFWLSEMVFLSKADFNALVKRVDHIEKTLADIGGKAQYHVVAPGESLSQIARKYGLTTNALRHLNKMAPRESIHPGQKLLVSEGS